MALQQGVLEREPGSTPGDLGAGMGGAVTSALTGIRKGQGHVHKQRYSPKRHPDPWGFPPRLLPTPLGTPQAFPFLWEGGKLRSNTSLQNLSLGRTVGSGGSVGGLSRVLQGV